ncbi:magnesium transporter [Endozoicomonas montiporae]|uniref:Magnesium transporter MgtE n=2 Tax=Endozoicomonas montiporae TaxID=1027273 RepID=A0A081N2W1_9GAMM|nr:magnesium transporter [Endozoicomonas montiporae]AMO58053.1 magnesium transporter [Endozoicomonas montiporae CL-33]KEQ12784.1 magnesium transporter [Endozoicomonas montiporae]
MVQQLQLSIGDKELKELNDALEHGVSPELRRMLNSLPAADVAHLLESSPPKLRSLLWRLIDQEQEGDVLQELGDEVRQFFLDRMNIAELKAITEGQDVDDVADLLQQLPGTITRRVLDSMDSQDRHRVEAVLSYPEDTAGGLMNTDTITVRASNTVDVVLRYLRRHDKIPEMTDSLLVVNRRDEYIGSLPLTTLLTTAPSASVYEVMQTDITPIPADTEDTQVAQIFERQDLVSAPVIDNKGKLLGRITIDDVVDVIREEAEHSMMSMAGLDDDEDTFAPVFKTARRRAIWLGINLITAFIAASVIGMFQTTIDKVVALAVLMPIVAGMGGNAGGQALTLVIRGMALGQISSTNLRWLLSRELAVGFMNGLLWAALVALIAYLWFNDPIISLVIGCAMVINLTAAVIVGASLPVILKSMNIDPSLAGTIILTTISDVLGFFSFLGLATLFYA